MYYLGISYDIQNVPALDPDFIPMGSWMDAYLRKAVRPFAVAIEREDGKISVFHSFLRDESYEKANVRYVERLVKFLLWSVGGRRVYLWGCGKEAAAVQEAYRPTGCRSFDCRFMEDVYQRPFEVIIVRRQEEFPQANEATVAAGGHLAGCRIGFDAGGSDRKVAAVIDGKVVYSEEVVWHPKDQSDPDYHYREIVAALKAAASKMPRVDAIGISSAGVFIGNAPMVSSLFIKVPRERREEVKTIYDRAAREIGENIPVVVANDGDVTALAGAMSLDSGSVMGLAMGTSQAAGYVDREGNLPGWFNELAFAPVDLNEQAPVDAWSQDRGVGCSYFSQDAVIRLAAKAGIRLQEALSPAEKLKEVQALANQGHSGARQIYASIGAYLAHTLPLYSRFYPLKYLLVLGRVTSGAGGKLLVEECRRILQEEYPRLAREVQVLLPEEKARRIGQAVAAASLPPGPSAPGQGNT